MSNFISFRTRVQIIHHLVEGNSLRATARLTDAARDTVSNLAFGIGLACLELHDRLVTNVRGERYEVDEVWAYVGRHEKCLLPSDPDYFGDTYTFFAIDPDSKLVPSYLTGKRHLDDATKFMRDFQKRVVGKPQISVDGWPDWIEAVRRSFGHTGCHLGSTMKEYQSQTDPDLHCPRNRVKSMTKMVIFGEPDEDLLSTSVAERLNVTTRMNQRRLTRLTNAFSKKFEPLCAAIGLHFMYYNFVREHETIRTTPAVKAGIESEPWTLERLVSTAYAEAGQDADEDDDW